MVFSKAKGTGENGNTCQSHVVKWASVPSVNYLKSHLLAKSEFYFCRISELRDIIFKYSRTGEMTQKHLPCQLDDLHSITGTHIEKLKAVAHICNYNIPSE